MANRNSDKKQENFDLFKDLMADPVKLIIVIIIIILIGVVAYMMITQHGSQGGAGMMEFLSETSPMGQLTQTPLM